MARDDSVFSQRLCNFDCSKRTNVAVVISAFGHAVNVRAKKNRSQTAVALGTTAYQIAHGIDRHVELRVTHQAHHVLAALAIGFAVSDAANAALRVLPELRQSFKVFVEARTIHAWLSFRDERKSMKRKRTGGGANKRVIEISPIHG